MTYFPLSRQSFYTIYDTIGGDSNWFVDINNSVQHVPEKNRGIVTFVPMATTSLDNSIIVGKLANPLYSYRDRDRGFQDKFLSQIRECALIYPSC